jgi:hypothetical protein
MRDQSTAAVVEIAVTDEDLARVAGERGRPSITTINCCW